MNCIRILNFRCRIITEIKNHLGHDNIRSTTIYLYLDLNRRWYIQRRFIRHMESVLTDDSEIEELLHWENEGDLKDMGVRPTQLTTKQPAFQKLSLIMICSKIYKICINVEMCEMCRPDTHGLPMRLILMC